MSYKVGEKKNQEVALGKAQTSAEHDSFGLFNDELDNVVKAIVVRYEKRVMRIMSNLTSDFFDMDLEKNLGRISKYKLI